MTLTEKSIGFSAAIGAFAMAFAITLA